VILSLVIGIGLRIVVASRMPIIETDGAMYASLASAILRGDWSHALSPFWPPLYPVMIAGAASIAHAFGQAVTPQALEASARAVSLLCSFALLVPFYLMGRRLLGERGAQWGLLLVLFHPRLVQFSGAALTETPFMLTLLVGLAALMSAWRIGAERAAVVASERTTATALEGAAATALERTATIVHEGAGASGAEASRAPRRRIIEAAAGIAFGLGYLIRPEALVIAAVVWAAGLAIRRREKILDRMSPAFVVGVLAVSAPFIIYLHAELGYWSIGEKGPYNFWREYRTAYAEVYPEPQGLGERSSESPELAAAIPPEPVHVAGFTVREPAAFLSRYLRNLATIVVSTFPVAVYHVFLVLAIVGLIGISGRRWWPVLVTVALFPFLFAAFSIDRRFYVPVIPLVALLSARGLGGLEAWVAKRIRHEMLGAVFSYILFAVFILGGTRYSMEHGSIDNAPEQRAAGEWLWRAWPRGAASDGARPLNERPVVMSRKPWVAYYAGGIIAELPDGPLEEVLARIKRTRSDVLVIDERWAGTARPHLSFLLDPTAAPAGFDIVYERTHPSRIILYSVRAIR
jgi:4-amino-4-deoxy-L-arabinose transferase-like glycosyltransferase